MNELKQGLNFSVWILSPSLLPFFPFKLFQFLVFCSTLQIKYGFAHVTFISSTHTMSPVLIPQASCTAQWKFPFI
jgi:hypothetical protein